MLSSQLHYLPVCTKNSDAGVVVMQSTEQSM
jgi:hypothetical protein